MTLELSKNEALMIISALRTLSEDDEKSPIERVGACNLVDKIRVSMYTDEDGD